MRSILTSALATAAVVSGEMRIGVIDENGNLTFHDGDQLDEILADTLSGDANTDRTIMGFVSDVEEIGEQYIDEDGQLATETQ